MNCREIEELAPLYLSEEIEEGPRALVQAHLAQCRSCASELDHKVALDARLRQAASMELPDAKAVERLVRGRIGVERARRFALMAAAAAIVVFAAILSYRALRPEPVGRLYADAAVDHRLEVMEHQPRHWRSDPAEIEKLAARYELHNVGALAPAGYRLEHAKMCGIDGKAALHLVFTNGSQEVSVYVRARSGVAKRSAVRTVNVASEQLAAVQGDRLEAIVATGGSSAECLRFARFAEGALQKT
jgi:anti-sigma factor RsiW